MNVVEIIMLALTAVLVLFNLYAFLFADRGTVYRKFTVVNRLINIVSFIVAFLIIYAVMPDTLTVLTSIRLIGSMIFAGILLMSILKYIAVYVIKNAIIRKKGGDKDDNIRDLHILCDIFIPSKSLVGIKGSILGLVLLNIVDIFHFIISLFNTTIG